MWSRGRIVILPGNDSHLFLGCSEGANGKEKKMKQGPRKRTGPGFLAARKKATSLGWRAALGKVECRCRKVYRVLVCLRSPVDSFFLCERVHRFTNSYSVDHS